MAIREPLMIKTAMASDTLTLKADPGEAFLIEEVNLDNVGTIEFAKLTIDRVALGYLSVYDNKQNQCYFTRDGAAFPNLMRTLFDKGLFAGYPVAEGQEFLLDITGGANKNSRITYKILDAGDINPEMVNGTNAKEFLFFNYGTNTAEIADGSYGGIDSCLVPTEFPDFPFGAVVPAKTEIHILALLVGTHRKGVYFGDAARYLRFTMGRKVLFDEDKTGFYVTHGMNNYPFHGENYERPVNLFPTPLIFHEGDEVNLELSAGGAAIPALGSLICLITKVIKLS